jgi:hypothetical protein
MVGSARDVLDTTALLADSAPGANPKKNRHKSDAVLALLRPGLETLGFDVEKGKRDEDKIQRPVFYGDQGVATVTYEIDAFHDEYGIAVEVEAGRGPQNNADYRDLIRASLLLDARFLALFMPIEYTHSDMKKPSGFATVFGYARSREQLDAIYASRRLLLPFEGVLLVGY